MERHSTRKVSHKAKGFHTLAMRQLRFIRETLQLSGPDLGAIFNVSRQAVDQWQSAGVSPDNLANIDRMYEAVFELSKRFKPQRLPAVVRSPMPILDDRSILQTLH